MNADYIFLFESGLLLSAAIGAVALARADRTWRWLAFFALTQAAVDWVDIAVSDTHVPGWVVLRLSLLAAGIATLGEFAVEPGFFRPWLRASYYGAVAVISATTCWLLDRDATAALLCAWGAYNAALAALALLRKSHRGTRGDKVRLWLAAVLLPPFVVISLIPTETLGPGGFAQPSGAGFERLEFFLTVGLSLLIYLHAAVVQQREMSAPTARAWRRRRYLCWAVVLGVSFAGVFVTEAEGNRKDAEMRHQVLLRAQLAASTIPGDLVRSLEWNDHDLASPAYRRLKTLVTAIRLSNADLRFALLAGLDSRRTFFLADSESPTSADYSPPGQPYDEADPGYVAQMVQRQPFVHGPFTDRWGTWVIASVPLVELGPGRGINLELDVSADHWFAGIRQARVPVVFIVLLASVIMIGSFQAQERLRLGAERIASARDAAEAATRAKSDFLAVMSHELRTPLAGVIGVVDLLRRDPPEPVRRQYIAVAGDSAQTLLRILDDILDMAKVEAGKLSLEQIAFDPREEFKLIGEAARLRAAVKGIQFACVLHPDLPAVLVGDPTRLRQVLGNLQNNALKFTETGSILVKISPEPIDARTVRLCIAVTDTGPGIDEPTRRRLFNKFEQADASTNRRYGGTGLGLSIVKAIAEAMHGEISVESEVGRGSTFRFCAPLSIGAPAALPRKTSADPAPDRPSVHLHLLCAEDEPVNRVVAGGLLGQLGHTVTFAENGQVAVERLRRERFDAVLMDGRMPLLDGLQATQLIRDPASGVLDPDVYICALTANASETDRAKCLACGMNDYLAKPLQRNPLIQALQRAADDLVRRGRQPVANAAARPVATPSGLSEAQLLSQLDEQSTTSSPRPAVPTELLLKLGPLFLKEAPIRLASIRQALAGDSAEGVANAAHALKSAAHYVGAAQLSHLAEHLEAEARAGRLAALASTATLAEQEFATFRHSLGRVHVR